MESGGTCDFHERRDATQRHIGALVVVCPEPACGGFLHVGDAVEEPLRERLVPHRPVVAFDVRVLLEFPRLNEIELSVALPCLGVHGVPDVLGAVVAANALRLSTPRDELIERPHDPFCGERQLRLDSETSRLRWSTT